MVGEILVGLPKEAREAGWELLPRLDEAGLQIQAAFWEFDEEIRRWRLVLSTPRVPNDGARTVILEIYKVLDALNAEARSRGEDGFILESSDLLVQSPETLKVKEAKRRYGSVPSERRAVRRIDLGWNDSYVYRT